MMTPPHGDAALLENLRIAFIGGGNMARSLIGGLVKQGCDPKRISVADPSAEQRELLTRQHPVRISADNRAAAEGADLLVFAVKPQVLRAAAEGLAELVRARQPLVVSIAAGINEPDLCAWLGGEVAIVRAMPNTPALLGAGAAGLYANPRVTPAQKALAQTLLEAVGTALWIE